MLARKGIPSIGTSVKVKHIHTDPLCICHFEQLEIPLKLLMLPHCWLRCKSFDLARKEMSLGAKGCLPIRSGRDGNRLLLLHLKKCLLTDLWRKIGGKNSFKPLHFPNQLELEYASVDNRRLFLIHCISSSCVYLLLRASLVDSLLSAPTIRTGEEHEDVHFFLLRIG